MSKKKPVFRPDCVFFRAIRKSPVEYHCQYHGKYLGQESFIISCGKDCAFYFREDGTSGKPCPRLKNSGQKVTGGHQLER